MIIKFSSDDTTVETRQVYHFPKSGAVEVITNNRRLLGVFQITCTQDVDGDVEEGPVGGRLGREPLTLDAEADGVSA
jgi:hypothetical protein